MKIGIVFAMDEELREMKKHIEIEKEHHIYDLKFLEGKINDNTCILVEAGVGKVNAARTTQVLIDKFEVDYIFNIGVCGGLVEDINVGDIIIGEKLVQHDFDITAFNHEKGYIPNTGVYIDSDKELVKLVESAIKETEISYRKGVIASGDIFCTDTKMSNKIHTKFNTLGVEMEGASVAQVCYLSKVPFLIIRSVSDKPNNDNVVTYEEFLEQSSKNVANLMNLVINKIK